MYYHKDDLTNYSRNLDLNKVHWRFNDKFRPLSELGYLDEWKSDVSQDFPFRTAISEVEKDSSAAEWNLPYGKSKNHFSRKSRRQQLNDEMRRKWMELNGLYGDDFKWARGLYSSTGNNRPRSSSQRWKRWRPEGFFGTLRPIHLKETHLTWRRLEDEENQRRLIEAEESKLQNEFLDGAFNDAKKRKSTAGGLGILGDGDEENISHRWKRKIKKKKKKESLWLDLESPYAEYLPALYREWAPKEPWL